MIRVGDITLCVCGKAIHLVRAREDVWVHFATQNLADREPHRATPMHRFTVARHDGIGPHSDGHPCASCGLPKSAHQKPPCQGMLNVKGESFPCDLTPPHDGWAHGSTAAGAIWQ
jgi:hypothetical protein